MLIGFDEIVEKYGKPKGIIHIGAHLLEEKYIYNHHKCNRIIWVEANKDIYDVISFLNKSKNKEWVYNFAVSNVNDKKVRLNITNNSESSSILKMDKHRKYYPDIYYNDYMYIPSIRMDTFFKRHDFNIRNYNFINLDIQGAELMALKGFGDLLKHIDFIYTEVNMNTLYKNCGLITDIDTHLSKFGFVRGDTKLTKKEWGDALYIKKN